MTDRELLEYAAKAAGIDLDCTVRPDGKPFYHSDRNAFAIAEGSWFAPLTDDGDALRLAVKLEINIEHLKTMGNNYAGVNCWPVGKGIHGGTEENITDPYAATRRAIVRAAAEIGKTK